jgi:SAM-dependent methyltransferase
MENTKQGKTCWFENWFDSEYYHILYNNRNFEEAELFISNLLDYLNVPAASKVLDLGCGKGRHSIFLNGKGLDVLGVDLSPNSIEKAKQFEKANLKFKVGDMREPQGFSEFDYVFNLFTSFGYFESDVENIKTLNAINLSLKENAFFIIDFMNAEKVKANLIPNQEINRSGLLFQIQKSIDNNVISKKINFSGNEKSYFFEERVQALNQNDFLNYFQKTGFKVLATFGDYQLNTFNLVESDRLIFVVQKLG